MQQPKQATVAVPLEGLTDLEAAHRIVEEVKDAHRSNARTRSNTVADGSALSRLGVIEKAIMDGDPDATHLEVDVRLVDGEGETAGGGDAR